MCKTFQKIILLLLCVFFALACGGGGGASSQSSNSNTSSNDDFAIDESLNFLTIANNANATQSQKDAVEYIKTYVVQGDNTNEEVYAELQTLTSLELFGWGVYDFNVLNGLSNLESITFYNYNDSEKNSKTLPSELNLNRLSQLSNLKTINFVNCDHSEIKNISDLLALEEISVDSETMKHGISFISSAKVKKVFLSSTSNNDDLDLSVFATLNNLENISFYFVHLKTFSDLSNLSKLKRINLNNSTCTSFLPLGVLNSLEELDYSSAGTPLTSTDLLPKAPNLKSLSMSGMTDDTFAVGSMAYYSKLESISISGVHIPSIDFTSWPASLNSIVVSYCDLEKIENMDHLVNLEKIDFTSNKLTEVDAIADLPNLQILFIIGNDILAFPEIVLSLDVFLH